MLAVYAASRRVASRMRSSLSLRLDIHNARSNLLSQVANPDSAESCWGQYIHIPPQKVLQIFCKFDESKAEWSLELYNNVYIAIIGKLPFRTRPKHSYSFHTVFSGKIIERLFEGIPDLCVG